MKYEDRMTKAMAMTLEELIYSYHCAIEAAENRKATLDKMIDRGRSPDDVKVERDALTEEVNVYKANLDRIDPMWWARAAMEPHQITDVTDERQALAAMPLVAEKDALREYVDELLKVTAEKDALREYDGSMKQKLLDALYHAEQINILLDKAYEAHLKEKATKADLNSCEPVAWRTEDYRADKSATTYRKDVANRWKKKGWPVWPLYAQAAASSDAKVLH